MAKLAVGAIPAIVLALSAVSFAAAQAPDVIVSELNCTGDPEVVVLTNSGDAEQNLTGWELRSDPEASEVIDLSVLGSLLPGGSLSIISGPSSSGIFTWGTDEIFRDGDVSDYVKLVDDTGSTVQQVDCAGAAPEPTPTATPAPSPTATPAPSPAGEMPNGGGPPPPSADMLSPGMILLIGGSLAALGVGAVALPRLRLRSSLVAASPLSRSSAAGRGRGDRGEKPGYSTVSLLAVTLTAVALTAVMAFRILRRRPG